MTMPSSKQDWLEIVPDSPEDLIKDELFDCEITKTSRQTDDIDYTIIESADDLSHPKTTESLETPSLKKSNTTKPKNVVPECKSSIVFTDLFFVRKQNRKNPSLFRYFFHILK